MADRNKIEPRISPVFVKHYHYVAGFTDGLYAALVVLRNAGVVDALDDEPHKAIDALIDEVNRRHDETAEATG